MLADAQYGYVLWPLTLAAAVVGLADARSRRAAILLVTLLGGMLVVWLFFTHLLGRFMVPAVPVAALLIGRVRLRAFAPVAAAGAVLMLLTTVTVVGPLLGPYADLGRRGFFGPTDLSFMLPKELSEAKNQGRPIILVGDAGAFFYQVPAGQLHYKAVFNLPADAPSAMAAWVDPTLKQPVLVVNPTEVERLHTTYRFVPPSRRPCRDLGTSVRVAVEERAEVSAPLNRRSPLQRAAGLSGRARSKIVEDQRRRPLKRATPGL